MPPVFAHGALRLYLLALLETGPKHGYELIKALGDRFGGTYTPSAGTIYPRLGKLEEEGLVATETEGRRTKYSITSAGRAELDSRREELADVEDTISASVRRLADNLREDIRSNMRGLRADLAATAEAARTNATSAAFRSRTAIGRILPPASGRGGLRSTAWSRVPCRCRWRRSAICRCAGRSRSAPPPPGPGRSSARPRPGSAI